MKPRLSCRKRLSRMLPIIISIPYWRFAYPNNPDARASFKFLFNHALSLDYLDRARILRKIISISDNMDCLHKEHEIIEIIETIIKNHTKVEGDIVECGVYKGCSTAKLSLVTDMINRRLYAFDTFEGLPREANYRDGRKFHKGQYRADMAEVKSNIKKLGNISNTELIKGDLKETLPNFKNKVSFAFLDIDLVESTRVALKALYPRLSKGGIIFSHDGHIPEITDLLSSTGFWNSIDSETPKIVGLGKKKLVKIIKPY